MSILLWLIGFIVFMLVWGIFDHIISGVMFGFGLLPEWLCLICWYNRNKDKSIPRSAKGGK